MMGFRLFMGFPIILQERSHKWKHYPFISHKRHLQVILLNKNILSKFEYIFKQNYNNIDDSICLINMCSLMSGLNVYT